MKRSSLPSLLCTILLGCAAKPAPETAPPAPITTPGPVAKPAPSPAPAGPLRYRGEVALPVGSPLELYVELLPEGEEHRGTIIIPSQMVMDAPLAEVSVEGGTMSFLLEGPGARWTATIDPDGTTHDCRFEQRGFELSCVFEPIDQAALAAIRNPPRPQTPAPPFPYDAVDVEYDNAADGVHLAGTLTLPREGGPHPAALLITGSGAQDRDETIKGHKPFLVIADHLTRQGIAVLRVDDRGVGGSTGSVPESTGEQLARDIKAGLAFLRAHERVDAGRVGLIGHSEGGMLGPRVAAEDPAVAFVVMMAGPGVPGHEVIREQAVAVLRASGAPETTIEMARHRQAKVLDVVLKNPDLDKARAELEALLGDQASAQIDAVLTPWYRDFIRHDPRPALRKLRCPVLVLNGTLDLQVLPEQNLPEIEKALAEAKNRRVEVRRLEGLNHLFQSAKTGSIEEYAAIEQTIDPEVLTLIHTWIGQQVARPRGKKTRRRGKRAR